MAKLDSTQEQSKSSFFKERNIFPAAGLSLVAGSVIGLGIAFGLWPAAVALVGVSITGFVGYTLFNYFSSNGGAKMGGVVPRTQDNENNAGKNNLPSDDSMGGVVPVPTQDNENNAGKNNLLSDDPMSGVVPVPMQDNVNNAGKNDLPSDDSTQKAMNAFAAGQTEETTPFCEKKGSDSSVHSADNHSDAAAAGSIIGIFSSNSAEAEAEA